jgi:hypothetical protein
MVEHMCQVQEGDARNWLFTMCDTLSHDQTIRMCTILWAIWHARRKAIYENIFQSPLSTHHFVESFLSDLLNQTKVEKMGKASKAMAPKPPRWLHPHAGMAKINTDAGRYVWFGNPSEGVCTPQTIMI